MNDLLECSVLTYLKLCHPCLSVYVGTNVSELSGDWLNGMHFICMYISGFGGLVGMLCVGIFANPDELGNVTYPGILHGGTFYLLGVQILGCLVVCLWSAFSTWVILAVSKHVFNMTAENCNDIV